MRLNQYIHEQKSLKEDPKLKKLYNKFNRELFKKILGTTLPDVTVGWNNRKKSVGTARATRKDGVITPESVSLSKNFKWSEEDIKGTLVHEMLHIYQYAQGTSGGHDKHFYNLVDRLNQHTDFEIPYTESHQERQVKGGKGRKYGVLLVNHMQYGPAIMVFSEKSFHESLQERLYSNFRNKSKSVYVGFSTHSLLSTFGTKRKIPRSGRLELDNITDDQFKEIRDSMEKKISKEFE